ncbi:MAG: hypothetical protein AAGA29_02640 [Planctomycetota bacterium]
MKPAHARALDILKSRNGSELWVTLKSGQVSKVFNIAWGYDLGEEIAHLTTNSSPKQKCQDAQGAADIGFFQTHEIARIMDPFDGTILFDLDDA